MQGLLHRRGRASARENLVAEHALVEVDQTIEIVGYQCDVVNGPRSAVPGLAADERTDRA
jgi:hypothetical protein